MTALRPDIVIIDEKKKSMHIFELTCPLEPNIAQRHTEKSQKYAHFVSDIDQFRTTVTCFEIGSRGYVYVITRKDSSYCILSASQILN